MRHALLLAASTLALSSAALAQSEAALRTAFEGKLISVKVGMPGTSRGIDVYPLEPAPVNWREVAERVKDNGTSLKIGDQVMITKVVVKKNSHIEFQLGGGGWGTFFDDAGTTNVSATSEGESQAEKDIKKAIKEAPGPTRRKELERELRTARDRRERENARARADAQQANAAHEANLRAKRAESGSRFNIRFRNGIPPESLTPEGVMAALAEFVDFNAGGTKVATASGASTATPSTSAKLSQLRKGLTVKEVEELLGPADTAGEEKQGALTINKRGYTSEGMKVSASFLNGVLVDFVIGPR
jgi:hypothetical protein